MSKDKKLELGSHNKLPHYSVIGDPTDFYVWINEDGRGQSSDWVKGQAGLYHELSKLRDKKNPEFIQKLKSVFESNRKNS